VNYSAAAQPHIAALENMRTRGYADGGLVTAGMADQVNASLATANALKDLPAPVVSVVEINRKQKSVAVKEKISRLRT
jgi:hypothetical protein